jgi:CheY-like chemotaxis protein
MTILAVDDKQINNKVIELDVEEYMEDNGVSLYTFYEVGNGQEAITLTEKENIDILFLDIMMPKLSGLEVLQIIREKKQISQPKIIMVTALDEQDIKDEAKKLGADGYISKPFDNKEIFQVLDRYVQISQKIQSEEEFFDFDEDEEFFDFDEGDDSIGIQKDMMDEFNKSHKKVAAETFLTEYDSISYMIEDLGELEEDIYEYLDNLFEDNLEENMPNIILTLDRYANFLNSFMEFQELSTSIKFLSRILEKSDFSEVSAKNKMIVAEFIKTILNDLVSWKNHVFVDQDAVDVFYLNASLLNSCIQIENILKEIK